MKREAILYEKFGDGVVECHLCSHRCRISDNNFGVCGVRQNSGGILYTHVYGKVIANHVDPIEKKPLYHFLPGSTSFSIATIGCNFRCGFCQNWQISQSNVRDGSGVGFGDYVLPETVVETACQQACKSISYTYTEPTIFLEYALDVATLAKGKGLRNIFVTNGFMTPEAVELMAPCIDAANVDLKFFTDEAYKKNCGGRLEPVLHAIRLMHKANIWVEITTLVIPGENDDAVQLKGIAEFIASVNPYIPWHLSRFHPDYQFTGYSTTAELALKAGEDIGRACGLKYIYIGHVQGWGNDTYCHNCKKMLIKREIFDILEYNIKGNACPHCNSIIPGIYA
jgi:pyruvate formate lyase activating enzyme